jgi:ABC-type transport system involved in multi-copper enzyme maturation permease subunit
MYRTSVIVRHTFREAVVQPIYSLLIGLGVAILVVFGLLPFFTLGEDTVMFKAVGLDVILLLVLIATLFATSKSIFDEIEDRTMLTLMSKPVRKWEVLVGKYLGIVLAALVAVAILGGVLVLATYWRIPGDYMIRATSLDDRELKNLADIRAMHIMGLVPSLTLVWLQIAVLAAIGVALSTRFSLVVNLPVVIILYIAGNLTRFLFPLQEGQGPLYKAFAWGISTVLPYLETFDLKARTVYAKIAVAGTHFADEKFGTVQLSQIWTYVGIATVYAAIYAVFALSAGMWIFQNREMGGGEG